LTGKSAALDFAEPSPKLLRHDGGELREKILALTQSEAKGLGIGKSTLHYLRRNGSNEHGFMVREKVRERLLTD
jgi:CRISPR-associated protein Cas1